MAVVIRLQGLPVVAGSADIRRFFSGLNIPDGGVHIIGEEKGEAFIIFATDEDARQAMSYSGGFIKDSRVEFFLSSKTEMQTIIEISRKRRSGSINSGASGIGDISNFVAAMNKSSYGSMDPMENKFRSNGSRNSDIDILEPNYNQLKKEMFPSVYVFIRGLPYSATDEDIRNFFSGLQVAGIAMRQVNGRNSGEAVVKFETISDATAGLQRDREYIGSRFIIVRPSGKRTWVRFGGKLDSPFSTHHLNEETFSSSREHSRREHTCSESPGRLMARTHSRSPAGRIASHAHSRSPAERALSRPHSRSPGGRALSRTHSRSPGRFKARPQSRSPRRIRTRTRSRSPRRMRTRSRSRSPRRVRTRTWSRSPSRRFMMRSHSRSPPQRFVAQPHSSLSPSQKKEYYILIKNLLPTIEKKDLIMFFRHPSVTASPIIFLKPDGEAKTKDAIMLCESVKVYEFVLTFHKEELLGQPIFIFPISKEKLLNMTGMSEKGSSERQHHAKEISDRDKYSGLKTCIYVRNFPFDVTNVEVQKFFAGFNIDKSDIYLLYDDKGIGLGEALVKFRTEEQARRAESLNRRRFLGTEVLLRCISEEQMKEFGINISSVSNEKIQENFRTYERADHFYPSGSQGSSLHGNLKHMSNYRHPSDDFICSSDLFRGPPSDGISGSFQEGHFRPDYNSSGGSDRVTMIKLRNIPFQASHNEILDFFHGYKIIPESLSILRNEYGMSSGEAILAVINYNEAVAAINELNDRPIGNRKVSLTFG